jgi:long-subunit fatty acid transport protein
LKVVGLEFGYKLAKQFGIFFSLNYFFYSHFDM